MATSRKFTPSVVRKTARELEAPIQTRCIEALVTLGCLVERRGENWGKKRTNSHYRGEPDLRVSYRGMTFGVEVKRDATEALRDDQIEWHTKNSRHVPYFVVCDHAHAMQAWQMVAGGRVESGAFDLRSGLMVPL